MSSIAETLEGLAAEIFEKGLLAYGSPEALVDRMKGKVNASESINEYRLLTVTLVFSHWCETGKILITCDATLASLLACTPTGPISTDDLIMPYTAAAFIFDPTLQCVMDGRELPSIRCLVLYPRSNLTYAFVHEDNSMVAGTISENELTSAIGNRHIDLNGLGYTYGMRIAIGLSRLIKSSPPEHRLESNASVEVIDHGISKKKGTRSIHVRRLFIVEPRVIDACRAALRGGPRAPCLRHLVRGHWRNQACGEKHQERELIWIQPHWRGTMRDVLRPTEVRVH